MEIDQGEVIDTILQIRNPETANSARDQMLEILAHLQSIDIIFQIIQIPNIDDFIYQFAIISIYQYCEIWKEYIDEELLDKIKSNLILVLDNIRDHTSFSILLKTISVVLKLFPSDWPEIQEYAFNVDDSRIIINIELLSILMSYFSDDIIDEKIDFFTELLCNIFDQDDQNEETLLDNINIQCSSVSFAVELVKRTQNEELADQLRPLITKLLEVVIYKTNFNSDLLNQILNPISEDTDFRLNLIDTNDATELAMNSIISKSTPIEYKLQLNNLLEICLRDIELKISEESLRSILAIEFNISIKLYQLEIEDERFSWSYQIESIVEYIFMRASNQFVINNVKINFERYRENEHEGIRFFQLLLLNQLSQHEVPNVDDLLISLYPHLLEFLSDPAPRVRNYGAITLGNVSLRIKDYIINNMLEILEKANEFVDEYHDEAGTFLLLSLIECSNNTDDFIETEYNFIKQFLSCSNNFICMDSIDIIKFLIKNSRSKYVLISEDAYSTMTEAISSDPSKYSGLLLPLSHLICEDDNLHDNFPDYVSLLKDGIDSEDSEIIERCFESAQHIIAFYQSKDFEKTDMMITELFPSIEKIANLDSDDNISCNLKGLSLITISYILYASQMNEDILSFYFQCIDDFLKANNDILTICTAKSFCQLLEFCEQSHIGCELIQNNQTIQNNISEIIEKIINSFAYDDTYGEIFINFISISVKFFGFDKLRVDSNSILKYLFLEMRYYIICQNSNISGTFKKSMKSIGSAIVTILICDSDENTKSNILETFAPNLAILMNDEHHPNGQSIAIHTFSLILKNQKLRSFFDDKEYDELIHQVISFINNDNFIVAKDACKFFLILLNSTHNKISLQNYSSEIIDKLLERFNSIDSQQNQSISFQETLIVTICLFYREYYESDIPEEILISVFSYLPLSNKFKYFNFMYQFLFQGSIQEKVKNNEELAKQLFRIFVLVISNRNKESNFIEETSFSLIAFYISEFMELFQSEEEESEAIAQIIGDDEVAFHSFWQLYPIYLKNYTEMTNPDIPLDITIIDLTNQVDLLDQDEGMNEEDSQDQ